MKKLSAIVMCLGMALIFATAGSSDLEMINGLQETVRLLIGLAMVTGGFIKGRLWE